MPRPLSTSYENIYGIREVFTINYWCHRHLLYGSNYFIHGLHNSLIFVGLCMSLKNDHTIGNPIKTPGNIALYGNIVFARR